jgi:hypothetical protein
VASVVEKVFCRRGEGREKVDVKGNDPKLMGK